MIAILMGLALLSLIVCNTPKPGVRYEVQEVHAQASPTPQPVMSVLDSGSSGTNQDWVLYRFKNTSILIFCETNFRGGVGCVKFTGGLMEQGQ